MNKLIKIAIIDCIGLNYDGSTLTKRGIGGSESSIISVARELTKLGFHVSIFNDCESNDTLPGNYDGVDYYPIRALGEREFNFDIVISQRTVIPFTPPHLYDQVKQSPPRDYDVAVFQQVQRPHQLKIMWMQDTFSWGDGLLEYLTVNNYINEIFNISDWHISYTTNCNHGTKRQFEVLKNKMFLTRNAINRWIDWVDVRNKDPNLFVYNASITKGMIPLVQKIWPRLKQHLPDARLKIIGGYYAFRNEPLSPAQQQWVELQQSVAHDSSIEFTGVIPQPEIAAIMANASYFLYPAAYPETSGISSIESINYNTPIIGTRFGAMEESATEAASYFMDYAIEPNGLYPWINTDQQVDRYVNLVLEVVNNRYLHQQKQYACNAIKDVSTWDTVALQWKQHFYYKLGLPLSSEEQDRVDWINYRVHKVFGRRFMNPEEVIVTPSSHNVDPLPYNKKVKVAFVDIVGMTYDGSTLEKRGLGGSESAVILNSRELAKLGVDVTVFNACDEGDSKPGIYHGVRYRPLAEIAYDFDRYDVVISSRVVTPFITPPWYGYPQTTNRKIDYAAFERMREYAKLKVFWMHDTFCWGDDILEDLVVAGAIDEVWTLSDFHTNYVMNCAHPRLRNYEVLRKHSWITRNGLVKYFDSVDVSAKDPNLFIFNANMSKGLDPLLNLVWPRILERIPSAKLTVIGGHYKLGAAFAHADEETEFMKLVGPHLNKPSIHFTGIISQKEVADWSARASFFIYPTAFPETYSISTLESLYANTPLITCRFGALEETAGPHSYLIDYSATPNGLYPNVDAAAQADKLASLAYTAYTDQDRQRRMKNLDSIKDIAGWDTVALEWKQHIYNKLGLYLSRGETRQARYTKSKYHREFGRRISTEEEWLAPKNRTEQHIVIVSPFYNAKDYIERCIASVAAQDYDNYDHYLIDDCSSDNGYYVAENYIKNLPVDVRNKFHLIRNTTNQGAVFNHITAIRAAHDDDIIMLLDGDDWLANRPDLFTYYNYIHADNDFTYGSCWSVVDNIPLISQEYPPAVKESKNYKNYKFNWVVPYTHLRTFKARLVKNEPDKVFQDPQSKWFRAGGDLSTFYTALLNCDVKKVYVVPDIVYNYNDANALNDYKVNKLEQDRTVEYITSHKSLKLEIPVRIEKPKPAVQLTPAKKKRILIAIPTNRNIEAQTFKSIYDLIIPDGYEVDFQYFWGYSRSQVKNLIGEWAKKYDYTMFVKNQGKLSRNIIQDMLLTNADIVLIEDSLIFFVKNDVFIKMEYPHFEYGDSEKIEIHNFIKKASLLGAKIQYLVNYYCP